MKSFRTLASVIALCVCVSHAQTSGKPIAEKIIWTPTDIGWPQDGPHSTVPRPIFTALKVGDVPVKFEQTTLESVQKHLGGVIGSHGDASKALAWLCYSGSDPDGRWIFWLDSGELGGLSVIDGFEWRRLSANEKPDHRCASLPDRSSSVELPFALRPGSAEADIRKILGKPSAAVGNTLFYSHAYTRIIRNEEFTVSNDLAVVIRDGVLWAMEGNQDTTN
jgi:hypothetical protein